MDGTKIDLSKMQALLMEGDDSSQKETPKGYFNKDCLNQSADDININSSDMCMILGLKGLMVGYSDTVEIKNLESTVMKFLNKKDVAKAKGCVVIYTVNPNVSMFSIGDVMEKLNEYLNNDCEIIFGTQTDKDFSKDTLHIKLLLTGIED